LVIRYLGEVACGLFNSDQLSPSNLCNKAL
jgi:hypothetical protein